MIRYQIAVVFISLVAVLFAVVLILQGQELKAMQEYAVKKGDAEWVVDSSTRTFYFRWKREPSK